jgi:hypothetical protein
VESRHACMRSNRCKEDAHAGKEACLRQTHMKKMKACEARIQEYLAMIGLGFW